MKRTEKILINRVGLETLTNVVEVEYVDMDKLGGVDVRTGNKINLWSDFHTASRIEDRLEGGEKVKVIVNNYIEQPDGRLFGYVDGVLGS